MAVIYLKYLGLGYYAYSLFFVLLGAQLAGGCLSYIAPRGSIGVSYGSVICLPLVFIVWGATHSRMLIAAYSRRLVREEMWMAGVEPRLYLRSFLYEIIYFSGFMYLIGALFMLAMDEAAVGPMGNSWRIVIIGFIVFVSGMIISISSFIGLCVGHAPGRIIAVQGTVQMLMSTLIPAGMFVIIILKCGPYIYDVYMISDLTERWIRGFDIFIFDILLLIFACCELVILWIQARRAIESVYVFE